MEFFAVDVETANFDMSSICQVGIVHFKNHKIFDEWSTFVNPEDYFHPLNISVHGITEDEVKNAPTFLQIHSDICSRLNQNITICHTHFDRTSLRKASQKHNVSEPQTIWLDSARVARRAWNEISWSGYGLKNICNMIGYEFKHHDALEDAKAAGHVILAAIEITGLTIEEWSDRVKKPISLDSSGSIKAKGNQDGHLAGESIAFTGALIVKRKDAAALAANAGCDVTTTVTKKTTLLVVGDQDIKKIGEKGKSSKQIKAEKLIAKGQQIRILQESDFHGLIDPQNDNT